MIVLSTASTIQPSKGYGLDDRMIGVRVTLKRLAPLAILSNSFLIILSFNAVEEPQLNISLNDKSSVVAAEWG
jgi:hypothetical protein